MAKLYKARIKMMWHNNMYLHPQYNNIEAPWHIFQLPEQIFCYDLYLQVYNYSPLVLNSSVRAVFSANNKKETEDFFPFHI